MTPAAQIFWKTKPIERVCHSIKDAEMLNLLKMVDDSVLTAMQLELLLYGDVVGRIPVCLYTYSESILESVTSLKQIPIKRWLYITISLKNWGLNDDTIEFQY